MIIDMSKSVVLYVRMTDREALSDPSMWDRVANAWGEEAGGWLQGPNFPRGLDVGKKIVQVVQKALACQDLMTEEI